MDNWEHRWKLFLVIIQTDQITVKCLVAKCEAASSTIRADLAHLALTFPIKSRRGNNGGYYFSDADCSFRKHAAFVVRIVEDMKKMECWNEADNQIAQEIILALTSIRAGENNTFHL